MAEYKNRKKEELAGVRTGSMVLMEKPGKKNYEKPSLKYVPSIKGLAQHLRFDYDSLRNIMPNRTMPDNALPEIQRAGLENTLNGKCVPGISGDSIFNMVETI